MQKDFLTLDDFDFKDKLVLVRVDINSPVEKGKITDDSRIRECAKTIKELSDKGAKVVVLAHQGRVGKSDFITLKNHAKIMSKNFGKRVKYIDDLFGRKAQNAIKRLKSSEILLLENTRFYSEEISFDDKPPEVMVNTHIVQNLAKLTDYFVNDAFAAAHRAQPSLIGFTEILPSIAGRVMEKEIEMLSRALKPERPCVAVLGGSKVDDSIDVATNMIKNKITDRILTTGLVANIFLAAKGYQLGTKNIEILKKELKEYDKILMQAKALLELDTYGNVIEVPSDIAINDEGKRKEISISSLPVEQLIQDIGHGAVERYSYLIKEAKTIIVNGPSGVFENEYFAYGTYELFKRIAEAQAFKVFGGGHTGAVVEKLKLQFKIEHLSTGGGACINFLASKKMPAVEALKKSKERELSGIYKQMTKN